MKSVHKVVAVILIFFILLLSRININDISNRISMKYFEQILPYRTDVLTKRRKFGFYRVGRFQRASDHQKPLNFDGNRFETPPTLPYIYTLFVHRLTKKNCTKQWYNFDEQIFIHIYYFFQYSPYSNCLKISILTLPRPTIQTPIFLRLRL